MKKGGHGIDIYTGIILSVHLSVFVPICPGFIQTILILSEPVKILQSNLVWCCIIMNWSVGHAKVWIAVSKVKVAVRVKVLTNWLFHFLTDNSWYGGHHHGPEVWNAIFKIIRLRWGLNFSAIVWSIIYYFLNHWMNCCYHTWYVVYKLKLTCWESTWAAAN